MAQHYKIRQMTEQDKVVKDLDDIIAVKENLNWKPSVFDDCERCRARIYANATGFKYDPKGSDANANAWRHATVIKASAHVNAGHEDENGEIVPDYWIKVRNHQNELATIEAFADEIKESDALFHWRHVNEARADVENCHYARPKFRCPKCFSLLVEVKQEAYGDSTDCPDCGYHDFFSIGD